MATNPVLESEYQVVKAAFSLRRLPWNQSRRPKSFWPSRHGRVVLRYLLRYILASFLQRGSRSHEVWWNSAPFGRPGTWLALLLWEFPLFTAESAISFPFRSHASTGNSGCDHSNPHLRSNLFPEIPLGHTLRSPVVSLKVFASNFTRVVIVLDVPLSIPVPSVRVLTEWVFVLFIPNQSNHQEPLPMPSPLVPNPHLPNLVKFNRLLYLLSR